MMRGGKIGVNLSKYHPGCQSWFAMMMRRAGCVIRRTFPAQSARHRSPEIQKTCFLTHPGRWTWPPPRPSPASRSAFCRRRGHPSRLRGGARGGCRRRSQASENRQTTLAVTEDDILTRRIANQAGRKRKQPTIFFFAALRSFGQFLHAVQDRLRTCFARD